MFSFPSLVAVLAILIAVVAYLKARRLSRKLEELTRSYWDLRYQHGMLRAQVARLDPESAPEQAPVAGYVPLASLKNPQQRVAEGE